jgi:hypothetical protein
MDAEEIKRRLREAGVPVDGSWKQTESKKGVMPKIVKEQADALRKIEGILQSQLEKDKQTAADLHIALQRIKNGGGTSG